MIKGNLLPVVVMAASLFAGPGLLAPLAEMPRHDLRNPGLEEAAQSRPWSGLVRLLPDLRGALPHQLYRPL